MNDETRFKEYLYSRDDAVKRAANLGIGIAIGNKSVSTGVGYRTYIKKAINELSAIFLIDPTLAEGAANKYANFMNQPSEQLNWISGASDILRYGDFYSEDDIKFMDDNSEIIHTCYKFISSGG